jgi:CDP-diacylglycerol pyrophosphatase
MIGARLVTRVLLALTFVGAAVAASANPNALWEIVHERCVPDMQAHGDPAPCASVALQAGVSQGYAALKDLRGVAQFLLIPTAPVSGIEDPALLAPGAPNYFAAAWQIRSYVEARLGRVLPRDGVSLAINSEFGRTQNQFHIHVDCIRADVREALRAQAPEIGELWAPLPVPLVGRHYLARRVLGEELGSADPFVLLADGVRGARQEMGLHTLVVVGASFVHGGPGFLLLDRRADLAAGDLASGEELQDHSCALAGLDQAEREPPPTAAQPH